MTTCSLGSSFLVNRICKQIPFGNYCSNANVVSGIIKIKMTVARASIIRRHFCSSFFSRQATILFIGRAGGIALKLQRNICFQLGQILKLSILY